MFLRWDTFENIERKGPIIMEKVIAEEREKIENVRFLRKGE